MIFARIQQLVSNQLGELGAGQYCAILGAHPSRGARSPELWNRAFKVLGIDCIFLPFDVAAEDVSALIELLSADHRFRGGAVTTPHKQAIASQLPILAREAQLIGAVNTLLHAPCGQILGMNTDALGASEFLTDRIGNLRGKHVVCLGAGGAGKAVATALLLEGARVVMWNRTIRKAQKFAAELERANLQLGLCELENALSSADVLVNCTSSGFTFDGQQSCASPLSSRDVALLPAHAFVWDIIYTPRETELMRLAARRGLSTANGIGMNRLQAIAAFRAVFSQYSPDTVAAAMETA